MKKAIRTAAGAIATFAIVYSSTAFPFDGAVWRAAGQVLQSISTREVPSAGTLEVAFSPKQGAETLVLKAIDSARSSIKVMAYSFTSSRVTAALLRAQKRGVAVSLVADEEHNLKNGASPKARAAFSAMSLAGAQVRVISAYAIHHDKVLIIDDLHVQLGSYNYSESAATRNSENVLVNWNNPALAAVHASYIPKNIGCMQIKYSPNC